MPDLDDGFAAFTTPSTGSTASALAQGLVVLDTNVYLDPYRLSEAGQADLLSVIEGLADHLFVPHQVAVEFWRNRETAARERQSRSTTAADRLDELRRDAVEEVRSWSRRLRLDDGISDGLVSSLDAAFEAVDDVVRSAGAVDLGRIRDTEADPVVARLRAALAGAVGEPPTPEDLATDVAEGLRRVEEKIPPGFKDAKNKSGSDQAGDYLVWIQALREAARRGDEVSDLVFVTSDSSGDDWFRRDGGEIRGPRIELFHEAAQVGGVRLCLLRLAGLLHHAEAALGVAVPEETVEEAERSDRASPRWNSQTLHDLLARLRSEGRVQRLAILTAIENGGFVGRDEVYELGGYGDDRMLKGFTRPTRRIMHWMQANGYLPDDVEEPLATVYEGGTWAVGFKVPPEFMEASLIEPRDI